MMRDLSGVAKATALFQGCNSVLGLGLSTAVEGEYEDEGAESQVACSVCQSSEDLAKALKVDQSFSIGFGLIASVDEKVSFMSSLKVSTYSVTVVVYARHKSGVSKVKDVRFKAGIKAPATDSERDDFVRAYGDSYVSSRTLGGEYFGVYTFYSQTREEQSSLVTSLSAGGVFSSLSVGTGLQTAMDNFLKTTTTRYSFQQMVTGIRNPEFPRPSDFVDYAIAFPKKELTAPAVIETSCTGYEHVPGMGNSFAKVVTNRQYFLGGAGVRGLSQDLVSIGEIHNQAQWIASIYDFYNDFIDERLNACRKAAKADISAIQNDMSRFDATATTNFTRPTLTALSYGTPSLSLEFGNSDAWGGGGGGPFDDVDIDTFVQNQTRISAVELRAGARIDRLTVTYESTTRKVVNDHGGNGGNGNASLQLSAGNRIVSVSGQYRNQWKSENNPDRVLQLKIVLNDGRFTAGGTDAEHAFSWTPAAGSFLLGFRGRSGAELDQLQIWYASFKPAAWEPLDLA